MLRNVPKALKEAYDYLETEVYNSLSSSEKLLLQTIAIFRIPETIEAFDSVNESNDLSVTLDELINKLLVNEIGSNTFKVHDIIRDYCLSDPKKKALRKFHKNAAKYYISLNDEPENILEAAYHYEKAGLMEKSFEILVINTENFISKGFWDKIETQLKKSINFFQRKTQPNALFLAAMSNFSVGSLYERKGEYNLALKHANQSKLLFNKIGERNRIFSTYTLLSSIYRHKNDIEKATEYNKKCFRIAEVQKSDCLKAIAIGNGATLLKNEDPKLRLEYLLEALKIFENYNELDKVAEILSNIAVAYTGMENFEKAYECIKRSLEIQKERNARYNIAEVKRTLAFIWVKDPSKLANYDQIIKCLEDIIETYERIGHKRGVAEALTLCGDVYIKCRNFKLAMKYYENSLEIYKNINDEEMVAETLLSIGNLYINIENFEFARKSFQDALEIYEKTNDKEMIAETLSSIGTIYNKNKNFGLAIEFYRKAHDLYSLLNQETDRINLEISLAELLLLAGNPKEAFDVVYEIIELNAGKNYLDSRVQALALFFAAVSSIMLDEVNQSSQFLQEIGNLDNKELQINWDFSDINPVLTKFGESKQLFLDIIAFLKGETSFIIVRPEDIQILEEEKGLKAKVYHPLTGCFLISVTDTDLVKLIKQIDQSQMINFDTSRILDLERKKALLMLGFLSKKGICEVKSLEGQNYRLELTNKGSRLLKSISY